MRIGSLPASPPAPSAARQVEARRTPASMSDVRTALTRAVQSVTGEPPRGRTIDVLAAQVSLETAHGQSMFNYNFGGIKGSSPQGATAHYKTQEVIDGSRQTLDQGFRAYGSIDEGARDYVHVLQARFPQAFAQAMTGNVDGFAHALKQSHYYTASEAEYASGLRGASGLPAGGGAAAGADALAAAGHVETSPSGFSTSAELSRVLDAVAASASRIADPDSKA